MSQPDTLERTPLHDLHVELGAKLVPFAGYEMPVQYGDGILAEHRHTRSQASLFDVSHMGQVSLAGDDAAAALETLVPADVRELPKYRMRYTQFTNERGGILDDFMVLNAADHLFLVVNAACKADDIARLRRRIGSRCAVEHLSDAALLALQGPAAEAVLARLDPRVEGMVFMGARRLTVSGVECYASRSGYTGEDGFELSLPAVEAEKVARRLLAEPEVAPAGLGARDSLRLEAGLCLYGHDIDTETTPVEAGLGWSVGKRRREEGGFPGADVILGQLADGPKRLRVGIVPEGRAPAREHTEITDASGRRVGAVTSGGFGPTVGGPIAMGYVEARLARPGTALNLVVRERPRPAKVAKLPFVPLHYRRKAGTGAPRTRGTR